MARKVWWEINWPKWKRNTTSPRVLKALAPKVVMTWMMRMRSASVMMPVLRTPLRKSEPEESFNTLEHCTCSCDLKSKTIIVIAGPTAVGKTSLAIQLAKHFQTEIISADSRQCFKELNIGVARPSDEELKEVPHHFVASYSIKENINAAFFEQFALQKTEELFKTHDIIIMVGGTGLYIKAFCEG